MVDMWSFITTDAPYNLLLMALLNVIFWYNICIVYEIMWRIIFHTSKSFNWSQPMAAKRYDVHTQPRKLKSM